MADYSEYEKQVIAEANMFVACDFRGRATYAREECKSRDEAKRAAAKLIAGRSPGAVKRPAMVYAVRGSNSVLCDLVAA